MGDDVLNGALPRTFLTVMVSFFQTLNDIQWSKLNDLPQHFPVFMFNQNILNLKCNAYYINQSILFL